MAHFAVMLTISPSTFKVMTSVCRVLVSRGHRVTFYDTIEYEKTVQDAGFGFTPWGVNANLETTRSVFEKNNLQSADLKSAFPLLDGLFTQRMNVIFQEMPLLLERDKIDALITDQNIIEARTLAEIRNIPFITLNPGIPVLQEATIPPSYESYTYDPSLLGILRNLWDYRVWNQLFWGKRVDQANQLRKSLGMKPHSINESWSPYAQITQMPKEFDYPRKKAPPQFHYVGPLDDPSFRKTTEPFPYEQLNGKPLVYASMGMVFNQDHSRFHAIAEACAALPVQLVITLGNQENSEAPRFAGSPLVVKHAPQLEVLKRTAIFVNHGGLNSVLEGLTEGVPMICLPISIDQFGTSGRVHWTGVGEFLNPEEINAQRLESLIRAMLEPDNHYGKRAQEMGVAFKKYSNATDRAADIIESVVLSKVPVFAA